MKKVLEFIKAFTIMGAFVDPEKIKDKADYTGSRRLYHINYVIQAAGSVIMFVPTYLTMNEILPEGLKWWAPIISLTGVGLFWATEASLYLRTPKKVKYTLMAFRIVVILTTFVSNAMMLKLLFLKKDAYAYHKAQVAPYNAKLFRPIVEAKSKYASERVKYVEDVTAIEAETHEWVDLRDNESEPIVMTSELSRPDGSVFHSSGVAGKGPKWSYYNTKHVNALKKLRSAQQRLSNYDRDQKMVIDGMTDQANRLAKSEEPTLREQIAFAFRSMDESDPYLAQAGQWIFYVFGLSFVCWEMAGPVYIGLNGRSRYEKHIARQEDQAEITEEAEFEIHKSRTIARLEDELTKIKTRNQSSGNTSNNSSGTV